MEQDPTKPCYCREVESLAPTTIRALSRFVVAGGTLFFLNCVPAKSAGMAEQDEAGTVAELVGQMQKNYPQRAALVKVDVSSLLTWFTDLQRRFNLAPDVLLSEPKDFLSQVHYRQAEREIFFLHELQRRSNAYI